MAVIASPLTPSEAIECRQMPDERIGIPSVDLRPEEMKFVVQSFFR
jgi:hypothetical protein